MRIQSSWVLRVLAITAVAIGTRQAEAQSIPNSGPAAFAPGAAPAGPAGYAPMPGYIPGPMPQMQPGYAPTTQMAPGMGSPYGYQPASYYDPSAGGPPQMLNPMPATPMAGGAAMGPMADPGMAMGMDMGMCDSCGGYGCDSCMGGCDNFDFSLLKYLLPYGAGGYCAQRWFDVEAEYLNLKRDDMPASQTFSTIGVDGTPALSMDDLVFDDAAGFKTTLAVQLGAGNIFEASYIGGFNYSANAEVTSEANNLFSVMSDFGLAPPGGFDDTDAAETHMIGYSSGMDTVEMNYRQRWVAANCRVQGSWLVGVRYLNLAEDFRYVTLAPANPGGMVYNVGTSNNLTGAQVGGDLWVCIIPGLHFGGEMKAGLFGNHAKALTHIDAQSFIEPVIEDMGSDRTAFVGDFNVAMLWRVSQNWTFRGGYQGVYIDGAALAPDNFNDGPPFVAGERTPFMNAAGDVFLHGISLGAEYQW